MERNRKPIALFRAICENEAFKELLEIKQELKAKDYELHITPKDFCK